MNKVFLKHDVLLVEDFLSKEECQKLIQWLDYIAENRLIEWNPISFYESYAMGFRDEDYSLQIFGLSKNYMKQLSEKVKLATEEMVGEPVSQITFHAQKWIPGAFASFHSDNSKDGEYTAFERSRYATFLYLNDDFEGGMLNFKDHDISIKPKTGMLVSFAGDHTNEHEVQLVKKGDRYTIGSFWDKASNTYSEETLKKWEEELVGTRAEQKEEMKRWEELKQQGIAVSPERGDDV